jgi:hypothetical protein
MAKPLIINGYRLERNEDFIHVSGPRDRITILAHYEYQEPGVVVLKVTDVEIQGPEDHGWSMDEDFTHIDGGATGHVVVGQEESVQLHYNIWFIDQNDRMALKYGQHPRERKHHVAVNLVNKPTIEEYALALGD